jgi:hypothetical protein
MSITYSLNYAINLEAELDREMSITFSLIYATNLEAELDHMSLIVPLTLFQLWGEIDTPHHFSTHQITWGTFSCGWELLFYILNFFVKTLR